MMPLPRPPSSAVSLGRGAAVHVIGLTTGAIPPLLIQLWRGGYAPPMANVPAGARGGCRLR
jgi:hypothetical protein